MTPLRSIVLYHYFPSYPKLWNALYLTNSLLFSNSTTCLTLTGPVSDLGIWRRLLCDWHTCHCTSLIPLLCPDPPLPVCSIWPLRSDATRPPCSSCRPCDSLSLVSTVELLHLRSPVVEQPSHLHRNCSLAANVPPQPEDSPLHSEPWLLWRSPLNILSLFPCLSLAPCILYLI